eukprot:1428223-Pleurochrysis_carterae.AAC.1
MCALRDEWELERRFLRRALQDERRVSVQRAAFEDECVHTREAHLALAIQLDELYALSVSVCADATGCAIDAIEDEHS